VAKKIIDIQVKGTDEIPLDKLIRFQGKLKRLPEENKQKLRNSILKNGFRIPIFTWNKKILDGHQRLKVLEELRQEGYEVPPIPVVELPQSSESEAKKTLLLINSRYGVIRQEGFYDFVEDFDLADLRDEIHIPEIDLDGLDENDIPETKDDDKLPEQIESISKTGDIWKLGDHRILCGDSTNKDQVLDLIRTKKAQCVFTDPPYGVSYRGVNNPNGRNWGVMKGDELRGNDLYKMLHKAFKLAHAHTINNPAVYVWHASPTQIIYETALNEAGFIVKEQLIWNKGMTLGHSDYHWAHEPCFYARKKDANSIWYGDREHKTIMRQETVDYTKMKKEELLQIILAIKDDSTVWEIKKNSAMFYLHPTQKPVDLAVKAIINSTEKGGIVLDLFLGSGSTLIACEKLGRRCYGVEISPAYCDVIIKRYVEFCQKNAKTVLLQRNGKPYELKE